MVYKAGREDGMVSSRITRTCGLAVLCLVAATTASAQWVFVAKKVVGKVSNLTKPRDAKNPGYDAATVILEADAAKVYSTALDLLKNNPKMEITKKDDAKRTVGFRQDDWGAQLQVTELGDHLCQLMIVAGTGPGETSGTSVVLDAVKRICDQLGVKYILE
jgi:hypothetical protein